MAGEPIVGHRVRVRVFVDHWNFQLSLNSLSGKGARFEADWRTLGALLAREALRVVDETAQLTYQGMNVYRHPQHSGTDSTEPVASANQAATPSGRAARGIAGA